MPHKARKRFGQNFLHDEQIIEQIVGCIAPDADDHIVEIGPGQGALTQYLGACRQLDVIELDRDLIPLLKRRFSHFERFNIHEHDALKFDFSTLSTQTRDLRIVGNLPYNISSPLLFHLFSQQSVIKDMHFMLQREVVERLCADVGSKAYGRLSIMAQYYCDAHMLFLVPPEAFDPAPKVESAIVQLIPHDRQPEVDALHLGRLVTHAFTLRRKTITNVFKNWLTGDELAALGFDRKARPENLSLADYVKLAQTISAL